MDIRYIIPSKAGTVPPSMSGAGRLEKGRGRAKAAGELPHENGRTLAGVRPFLRAVRSRSPPRKPKPYRTVIP